MVELGSTHVCRVAFSDEHGEKQKLILFYCLSIGPDENQTTLPIFQTSSRL